MKKQLCLSLSLILLLCLILTACGNQGGSSPEAGTSGGTGASTSIPDTKEFYYDKGGFTLQLPVDAPDPKSGETSLLLEDPEGEWTMTFTPMEYQTFQNNRSTISGAFERNQDAMNNITIDESASIGGYQASHFACDAKEDTAGAYNFFVRSSMAYYYVDYAEKAIAGKNGLEIKIVSSERLGDIKKISGDPLLSAALSGLAFDEATTVKTASIDGLSVEFPVIWSTGTSEPFGLYAGMNGEHKGSIYFSAYKPADAKTAAGYASDSIKEVKFGSQLWYAVLHTYGENHNYLELYTDYSKNYCMQVKIALYNADGSDLDDAAKWAYLDADELKTIMESAILEPDSFQDPENARVNEDGLKVSEQGYITEYTGQGGDLVIPSFIGDYSVLGIWTPIFKDNTSITSVTFEEGVSYICPKAFAGCTNLKSVTLPNSMTTIDYAAFQGCTTLQSVTFGSGLTSIGYDAFRDCPALGDVSLPDSLVSVGYNAFDSSGSGGSFTGGTGTVYEEYALARSSFDTVIFGDDSDLSAQGILADSFVNNVTVGAGTTALGNEFFRSPLVPSESDPNITVSDPRPVEVNLPDSIREIGEGAFEGRNVSEINLGSIETLGSYAFQGSGLQTIRIPGTLKEITHDSFRESYYLGEVIIENGVETIGSGAFYSCGRQDYINHKVFYPWRIISKEDMAKVTAYIKEPDKDGCPDFLSIYVPGSVKKIESYAFADMYLEGVFFLDAQSAADLPSFDPDTFWGVRGIGQIYFTEDVINSKMEELDAFFGQFPTIGEVTYFYNGFDEMIFVDEEGNKALTDLFN